MGHGERRKEKGERRRGQQQTIGNLYFTIFVENRSHGNFDKRKKIRKDAYTQIKNKRPDLR